VGVTAGSREVPGRKPVTRDNDVDDDDEDDDDDNNNNNKARFPKRNSYSNSRPTRVYEYM
jgi:hypothetical protein